MMLARRRMVASGHMKSISDPMPDSGLPNCAPGSGLLPRLPAPDPAGRVDPALAEFFTPDEMRTLEDLAAVTPAPAVADVGEPAATEPTKKRRPGGKETR